jgi:hypothetical protein
MLTTMSRLWRTIADRRQPPPVTAAADPAPSPGRVSSTPITPPDGRTTDLDTCPASIVEQRLATEWLATGEPATRDDLYRVCGSIDRACAVVLDVRQQQQRDADAAALLDRVFGGAR